MRRTTLSTFLTRVSDASDMVTATSPQGLKKRRVSETGDNLVMREVARTMTYIYEVPPFATCSKELRSTWKHSTSVSFATVLYRTHRQARVLLVPVTVTEQSTRSAFLPPFVPSSGSLRHRPFAPSRTGAEFNNRCDMVGFRRVSSAISGQEGDTRALLESTDCLTSLTTSCNCVSSTMSAAPLLRDDLFPLTDDLHSTVV